MAVWSPLSAAAAAAPEARHAAGGDAPCGAPSPSGPERDATQAGGGEAPCGDVQLQIAAAACPGGVSCQADDSWTLSDMDAPSPPSPPSGARDSHGRAGKGTVPAVDGEPPKTIP